MSILPPDYSFNAVPFKIWQDFLYTQVHSKIYVEGKGTKIARILEKAE